MDHQPYPCPICIEKRVQVIIISQTKYLNLYRYPALPSR